MLPKGRRGKERQFRADGRDAAARLPPRHVRFYQQLQGAFKHRHAARIRAHRRAAVKKPDAGQHHHLIAPAFRLRAAKGQRDVRRQQTFAAQYRSALVSHLTGNGNIHPQQTGRRATSAIPAVAWRLTGRNAPIRLAARADGNQAKRTARIRRQTADIERNTRATLPLPPAGEDTRQQNALLCRAGLCRARRLRRARRGTAAVRTRIHGDSSHRALLSITAYARQKNRTQKNPGTKPGCDD